MEFPDWVQVKEKHYRWPTRACHEITLVMHTNEQRFSITETIVYCTHTVMITIIQAWAVRAELQYSGKTEIQKQPELFRNPQSFVSCSMERSIRYKFFLLIWRAFNISSHLIIV